MARHRAALADVLVHGTWLEWSDVDAFLNLPVPGIDELIGMVEIGRLAARGYDIVVVDTAPTGHALRLIAAPETVKAVAAELDDLQEEHRIVRRQFGRAGPPDAADQMIETIAGEAAEMSRVLRHPSRTTFHWVTLPETLSVAESEDGIRTLTDAGIQVRELVVNRLLPKGDRCPLCDRRRAAERAVLARIERTIGHGRRIRVVEAARREPRGVAALLALADRQTRKTAGLDAPNVISRASRASRVAGVAGVARVAGVSGAKSAPALLDRVGSARLIFVGGKGGVGKTTVAASIALRLSRARPDASVLLLSTDPAHSLGDVLKSAVQNAPAPVVGGPRNLLARELDSAEAMRQTRADLTAALEEIAAPGTLQAGPAVGWRASAARLMELAPPGIDELFGMLSIVDAADRHDLVVVDSAPTGHALRLLNMPETAREWLHALIRMLLKYRSLVRPGRFAADLVNSSRKVRELQQLLGDRSKTRFVVVTRAAAVPRAETERLLRTLRSMSLPAGAVIVNARTLSPGVCRWCRAVSADEERESAALVRSRDCAIIHAPLTAPPPRGVAGLDRWARAWIR
jgi:arsenite-transporting ATPase